MHWAEQYIGLPWSATGEGPPRGEEGRSPDRETWSFHCWAFICWVQERHFGRSLPAIANPEDLLGIARDFRDHPERKRWAGVEDPAEGDCVLMRQARYPIHVGVWLDVDAKGTECGVLHCAQEAGVVFQGVPALAANGWRIEGTYRFTGNP